MWYAAQKANTSEATNTASTRDGPLTVKTWPTEHSTDTWASRLMFKTWPQWTSETDVG